MRLMLMEASPVTGWLIRRLLPPDVELVQVSDPEEAERVLREEPLDGAVFGLTTASLPWSRLRDLCERRVPRIPHMWYYSLCEVPGDGELSPEAAPELPPVLLEELEERLARFLARIGAGRTERPVRANPGERRVRE